MARHETAPDPAIALRRPDQVEVAVRPQPRRGLGDFGDAQAAASGEMLALAIAVATEVTRRLGMVDETLRDATPGNLAVALEPLVLESGHGLTHRPVQHVLCQARMRGEGRVELREAIIHCPIAVERRTKRGQLARRQVLPLHPIQETGERDKALACRLGVLQNAPHGLPVEPSDDRRA